MRHVVPLAVDAGHLAQDGVGVIVGLPTDRSGDDGAGGHVRYALGRLVRAGEYAGVVLDTIQVQVQVAEFWN